MSRLLGLAFVTIVAWVVALDAAPPLDRIDATPQTDRAHALASTWTWDMSPSMGITLPDLVATPKATTVRHDGQASVEVRITAPVHYPLPVDETPTAFLRRDGTATLEWSQGDRWREWAEPIVVENGQGSLTWKPPGTATYRTHYGSVPTGVAYSEPFTVTVKPPPPPPRKWVPRNYGPKPALTGPILLTGGKYIGVAYVSGGSSPAGFDCSGFVQYVYRENGTTIPRTTSGIRNAGTVTTNPEPGDIMYWPSGHVALYVAPGWRLDANHPGSTVQVRPSFGSPIYLTF